MAQNPNLFNLDPRAYQLFRGGRQFDQVRQIRDPKEVGINPADASRLAGQGYEPVLAAIRAQQGKMQAAGDQLSVNQNTLKQYNQTVGAQVTDGVLRAGADVVGNAALGKLIGPVGLVSKGVDVILQDDSAVNDFVRKAISDEAGDALNSVAEGAQEVSKGVKTAGNAIGDVAYGALQKLPGFSSAFGTISTVGNLLFGKSGPQLTAEERRNQIYVSEYNKGYDYYTQHKNNYTPAADQSFENQLNFILGDYYADTLTPYINASWQTPETSAMMQANIERYRAKDAEYLKQQLVDVTTGTYGENDYLRKGAAAAFGQDYLTWAQEYEKEQAAQEATAAAERKNEYLASLGRAPGSSPDAGYDIPTEPIARGIQLGNTNLYNDDLHQQMIARSK